MNRPTGIAPDPQGQWTVEQWTQWMQRERWCGGEHPERVALLITHILRGMQYVRKQVRTTLPKYQPPPFLLLRDAPRDHVHKLGAYLPAQRYIVSSPVCLQQFAVFSFEELIGAKRSDGAVAMIGTPPDIAFLAEVEEADHAAYHQEYGLAPVSTVDARHMTVAQYDAQPHEFHALGRQILAAKEHGLPEPTRRILVQRWQTAQALRDLSNR